MEVPHEIIVRRKDEGVPMSGDMFDAGVGQAKPRDIRRAIASSLRG